MVYARGSILGNYKNLFQSFMGGSTINYGTNFVTIHNDMEEEIMSNQRLCTRAKLYVSQKYV